MKQITMCDFCLGESYDNQCTVPSWEITNNISQVGCVRHTKWTRGNKYISNHKFTSIGNEFHVSIRSVKSTVFQRS